MRVEVTARHFKAPKELRDFTEKEVTKLERYFDGVLNCRVILSRENGRVSAEIVAHSKKRQFKVIETGQKMDRAVVVAVDKLRTQLQRHKARLIHK
ncbi:MAG: ribosome-associated translation inhibitor RaiA [Fidelibacterota bacterium]|nr:MAG: ribosome-associated translation inhibitor RaiA [Candidatus Neomarinimicrobiota bacterium]